MQKNIASRIILLQMTQNSTSEKIMKRMKKNGKRFWAGDNISEYVSEQERKELIVQTTKAFEKVLDTLLIDRETDPNSRQTAQRLAKMYYNQLMVGRYEPKPQATSFPNQAQNFYDGMIVVRAQIRSICSHHHQPVAGVAYIGVIAVNKLIGLSKYSRIAQWCARRGTLQQQLCNEIIQEIELATGSKNVAIYIQATHGCCQNRGIMAQNSLTQTTVFRGLFKTDININRQFYQNIKFQQIGIGK